MSNSNIRVPVVDPEGKPLMPTTSSRARRWMEQGKAIAKWSDLGMFYVQAELCKIFPVSAIFYKPVKADVDLSRRF